MSHVSLQPRFVAESRLDWGGKYLYLPYYNRNLDFTVGILGYYLRVCRVSRDKFKCTALDNSPVIVPLGVHERGR